MAAVEVLPLNLSHLRPIRVGCSPTITDPIIKSLVVSGLLVQTTAVALGFTRVGWRWPSAAAGALVSLGFLFVLFADGGKFDGLEYGMLALSVLTLALAAGRALSTHPAIAAFLWGAMAIQAVIMIFLTLVLFFLKMNKLF
jgi:hypothetical protein